MITVTILTKNNSETLGFTLESLQKFDEIIILDTGSKDLTLSIARTYSNVKIFESPFTGFGSLRNLAARYAKHDWILSLDSDEVLSLELCQEILSLKLDSSKVYSFPFNNYFNGRHIKWCGWYPDRHVRLYNKQVTSFTWDEVHERIETNSLIEEKLFSPVRHYSYRSISDFLQKMDLYSTLFAKQNVGKKSSSLGKAFFHALFAFIQSYFIKRGFLGGKEGYLISLYKSQTTFYKYLKLLYANRSSLP